MTNGLQKEELLMYGIIIKYNTINQRELPIDQKQKDIKKD